MKKVALIGATGFVGSAILRELTTRNYTVTAIARDVQKIKSASNVIAVQADVIEDTALTAALKGNDIVVSAFNSGWSNPSIYDDYLAGGRAIIHAIKEAGIARALFIGGAGSLEIDGNKLIDADDFPEDIKQGAKAASDYLEIVKREYDLDWTFFSPAIEMNAKSSGTRTGKYRTNLDSPVFDKDGHSRLSVEDLAVAIADELEDAKFIKKRFTAGY
ncbi:NAD(P)-dependent oxidoreductase [Sphingobacterium deserti]|uniref:NAD-dependent epimerase/dehydratase n=1 Tax=Sphingobacterium deserti TaxID=1229276 RepID=A0A0B8SZ44_9SPHI|nr:NAD(P)H-binding protein [Sphingobacterium deserti]KGE12872.1 NAD-dependent epimerase/dehydratase [Sphingobacterium deserti]